MALFGSIETLRAQAPQTRVFAAAFDYVDELLRAGSPAHARIRALAAGHSQKIELEGGAFGIEQAYETKARPEGFFESHLKYIDLQVIVEGEELMEVIDGARMAMRESYQAERDLITYKDTADASLLRMVAGQAAIFFPIDVHMPSLRLRGGPGLVRKTVVKIPVA